MVLNRYLRSNPPRYRVLEYFVNSEQYEFTLDDSNKIITVNLSGEKGATFLDNGSLISMNVLLEILGPGKGQRSGIPCPLCKTELPMPSDGAERVLW